jgi:CDI immunity proteins
VRSNRNNVTFAALDKRKGVPALEPTDDQEFPLPAWYRSVYNIPIEQLGIEDLAKACRQNIHLEEVVPIIADRLKDDPYAGEMYEGELLVSLKSVPKDFWSAKSAAVQTLSGVCSMVAEDCDAPRELREDAAELLCAMKK